MNINFLFNRLRRMSAAEIASRIEHKIYWEYRKRIKPKLKEKSISLRLPIKLQYIDNEVDKVWNECANKTLNKTYDFFALKNMHIDKLDYHRDYKSNLSAPMDRFGPWINYRDSAKIGDIKYIWEPSRHLFLLPLAIRYNLTGNVKYIDNILYEVENWIKQNPFLYGVNWCSSLELGIRLIQWSFCRSLINDKISPDFKKKWDYSIKQHCWFISKHFSGYSSANNHLIGEAAGLYIATMMLDLGAAGKAWSRTAKEILEREIINQNYSDGVNKEQAISYQQFVYDFLIMAYCIGKKLNDEFSQEYLEMLYKMGIFIKQITFNGFVIPQFGDEDDGYVIDVGQRQYGVYRSICNTHDWVFNGLENNNDDAKTVFLKLLIGDNKVEKEAAKKFNANIKNFPQGGYYILSSGKDPRTCQRMIFDCGELGLGSLAAHGHADALSIFFSIGDKPVLIDPGTYAYHTEKLWRNYFRGTSAHNTICVDGRNQSEITGNFMWGDRADCKLIDFKENEYIIASHNGYLKSCGVSHIRELTNNEGDGFWVIKDSLAGNGSHKFDLYYHISPELDVKLINNTEIHLQNNHCNVILLINCSEKSINTEIINGNNSNEVGWYSPSYNCKIPINTVHIYGSFNSKLELETKILVEMN